LDDGLHVRITADTNVLVRAIVGDDERQAAVAIAELAAADVVVLTMPTLCELAWVLLRSYKFPVAEVAMTLRGLIAGDTVAVDRLSAEAGLEFLGAGGDFADGVIAFEGRRMGGEVFVSFDTEAVHGLAAQGGSARLLR
jgi:predicted nucleic-acid-binding protein